MKSQLLLTECFIAISLFMILIFSVFSVLSRPKEDVRSKVLMVLYYMDEAGKLRELIFNNKTSELENILRQCLNRNVKISIAPLGKKLQNKGGLVVKYLIAGRVGKYEPLKLLVYVI